MIETLDFSHINIEGPPRPSKWDIIPIHNSDRATFKFCRRQWKWSSPNQLNLIPRASVYGVIKPLWFGTGIHYALERYYNPRLREDPAIAWETWFNLQWFGGVVDESEVKQFADRDPQPIIHEAGTYKVAGLCDILPDTTDNEEIFLGMKDLGTGMMRFYKDYAEEHDNFDVVALEHDFSVPVLNDKGEPLYMIDNRVMPDGWEPNFDEGNEFGPLMRQVTKKEATPVKVAATKGAMTKEQYAALFGKKAVKTVNTGQIEKQVHARGRQDMIQQDREHGRFGIMDYKTASRIDDDYFRHLELDEQCTSYLAFGQLEARLHDLEYKELEYITYQAILKGYPKPPTMLKSGLPSTNRTEETTTPALFEQFIREHGLTEVFKVDTRLQNYYTYLLELGDKRYIQRTDTWRNHAQRKNAMTRLYYEAQDMLNNPVAYPNPSKNYSCLNCVFRLPCLQAETGDDYVTTLEDGYIPNWDR